MAIKIKSIYTLLFVGLVTLVSCSTRSGEVVESAYIEPLFPEPKYSFSRNGSSSVDTRECGFINEPLQYLYDSKLRQARLGTRYDYDEFVEQYKNGWFGVKLRDEIARSSFVLSSRESILQDIDKLIDITAVISGLGSDDHVLHRRQEAQAGHTGYVGKNIGDKDIYFVDEQGMVVADIFKYAMMGAIYLDKIINIHLDEATLTDLPLRKAHEDVVLPSGRNYTHLEHHWDLAYGYYAFWKPLAESEGIRVLRDSEDKIFRAFVEGRTVMETFRYSDMLAQAKIIKAELARVIIIRAIHLLVGDNTIANLEEQPKYAFRFISQACGLIYATQFLRDADGKPYFSYDEVKAILDSLNEGEGLWDGKRLLAGAETQGSLLNIATRLGKPIGIVPQDIKK